MKKTSNILRSDSYKMSHWKQLPPGTEHMSSYMESRGGRFNETVFFGLQYYLKEYLSRPITMADVDYAETRITKHMGPGIFNRADWERIVNVHGGFMPVKIKAVPEGTVVPVHNVMAVFEGTDPQLPWVEAYTETMLMKVWYPITVATISRSIKKLILKQLEKSGDPTTIDFKLHDFGYRGASSEESAGIGGMAHLVNFKGTDTFIALEYAEMYYDEDMAGFSIPASEHSTITAWGQSFEYEAYKNMIEQFGQGDMYAVVSDSYDIYNACSTIWGEQLISRVLKAPGTLIIRPDSGVPHKIVLEIVTLLGEKFGYTINDKDYKVLNKVRVIQGDGIDEDEIERILEALLDAGWSADNVAFGMGGALLQKCDRDTQKFAIKASSMVINGKIRDVYKDPITDTGKRSKRGRLKLIWNEYGEMETVTVDHLGQDIMQYVWDTGKLLVDQSFVDIRDRVNV